MEAFNSKKGVSLYAYKGDAMTLLAFDLAPSLTDNFVGFTVHVKTRKRSYYLYNKLTFKKDIAYEQEPKNEKDKFSTEFSPIQKFRWVHVPSSEHYVLNPYFGDYQYSITPRYVVDGVLLKADSSKTVSVTIDVSPFHDGDLQIGFTRAFVSSQAYAYHFGNNTKIRPDKKSLVFDTKEVSGHSERWDNKKNAYVKMAFTYEEQHEYLGWQARDRAIEFLDEVINNKTLVLDVFAYDLNEPKVIEKLLTIAKQGRMRIILDNYAGHIKPECWEEKFEKLYKENAKDKGSIFRGKFQMQSHSKIFIQRRKSNGAGVKVLTGSLNFTTNGMCINANHTLVFSNRAVAQLYSDVFDQSFGDEEMADFKNTELAEREYHFREGGLPDMTIRFSPHPKHVVDQFFSAISKRILNATSDVLFAIMIDNSSSDILDAIQTQVKGDDIFTYGITDKR